MDFYYFINKRLRWKRFSNVLHSFCYLLEVNTRRLRFLVGRCNAECILILNFEKGTLLFLHRSRLRDSRQFFTVFFVKAPVMSFSSHNKLKAIKTSKILWLVGYFCKDFYLFNLIIIEMNIKFRFSPLRKHEKYSVTTHSRDN